MLKILLFSNPPGSNLCFSNAVMSMLLNIAVINQIFSADVDSSNLGSEGNEITQELSKLCKKTQFSFQSTQRMRTIVKIKCFKDGQLTRKFNDKKQHDAGEFMISLFEHLFRESFQPLDISEQIFGGLMQEQIFCQCGKVRTLPVQNLPEIWTVQIDGPNLQTCVENFLKKEDINLKCEECGILRTEKKVNLVVKPNTLIIQLKRYEYDCVSQQIFKKHDSVICPSTLTFESGSEYTLSSIINHEGSTPASGHYTLAIYNQQTNSYIMLDDTETGYDLQMDERMSRLSYIVSYIKN